jgi:hypothetical protein
VGLAFLFRGMEAILRQPLSAAARFLGLCLVFPALLSDVSGSPPCRSLVALILVLSAFALLRGRRELEGGALLGLAVLVKGSLLVVLPWLAYRRRLRALLAAAALALGGYWLRAATARDLEWFDWRLPADWLHAALAIALLTLVLVACWRRRPGARLDYSGPEIAAALATAVLLAPAGAFRDGVLLLPAAVAGYDAWRLSRKAGWRRLGAVLWTGAFVLAAAGGLARLGYLPELDALPAFALAAIPLLVLNAFGRFHPEAVDLTVKGA